MYIKDDINRLGNTKRICVAEISPAQMRKKESAIDWDCFMFKTDMNFLS